MTPVRRFGSVINLAPGKEEEYEILHAAVWPEVLSTITECNIRNYTIFRFGDCLFSYYEYTGDNHASDMQKMSHDPLTQQWWALTDPCQTKVEGSGPDEWWASMREIFHHP